ncbi:MAG: hypothetical protein JWO01_2692, partial [Microbacteriaceae bacterium]|nr:hypothetical protein [Microbacteriaceae bacterium]
VSGLAPARSASLYRGLPVIDPVTVVPLVKRRGAVAQLVRAADS